jgi:hypothetical protein
MIPLETNWSVSHSINILRKKVDLMHKNHVLTMRRNTTAAEQIPQRILLCWISNLPGTDETLALTSTP